MDVAGGTSSSGSGGGRRRATAGGGRRAAAGAGGHGRLRHHRRDGSSAVPPSRQKHFAAAASRVEARKTPEATGSHSEFAAGRPWSLGVCRSRPLPSLYPSPFTCISLFIRVSACLSAFLYLSSYRTTHACLTVFLNFIMSAVLIIFLPPISFPFKPSRYRATYLHSLFFFSVSSPSPPPSSVTCPFVLLYNRLHPISQARLSSVM